jgi:hypothetical protein
METEMDRAAKQHHKRLSSMKTILLLFLFTAKTVVAAQSIPLTPESIYERTKMVGRGLDKEQLIKEILASKNLENVRAAFRGPNIGIVRAIEAMDDSDFKDQMMIMIMNEPWGNDIESTSEGSRGMGPELYVINFLAKRAPELKLHIGSGTQERFSSHKTRKEVANALQAKIDNEKNPVLINPKSQDSESVSATSVTSANGSESQQSLSTTVPEPATKQPANRYILQVVSVTLLSLLYFFLKKRHK